MGVRYGEKDAKPAPRIRRAKKREVEFINAGNDVTVEEEEIKSSKNGKSLGLRHVDKLSDFQIDAASDRVIMGESIAKVAQELRVSANALAKKIKIRCGMLYQRKWQQSVAYDCLRAELLLKKAMYNEEDPRWAKIALDVLRYRAEVLGFEKVNPNSETAVRVAGLTQTQVFEAIAERL